MRKYLKNDPKSMSKHIDKFLMTPIWHLKNTQDHFSRYKSNLFLQYFDFSRSYKSKNIFCGTMLCYNFLPNPNVGYEQLTSSYSFKIGFYQDNDLGMQEDASNILKIDKKQIQKTVEFPQEDMNNHIKPKSIFLDKITLINLLLRKYDYEFGKSSLQVPDQNLKPGSFLFDDDNKYKSNHILLKIDGLLEKLNDRTIQYMMEHFQVSNMPEYRDFFHRLVFVGNKDRVYKKFKHMPTDKTYKNYEIELNSFGYHKNNSINPKLFKIDAQEVESDHGASGSIKSPKNAFKDMIKEGFKITVNHDARKDKNQPEKAKGSRKDLLKIKLNKDDEDPVKGIHFNKQNGLEVQSPSIQSRISFSNNMEENHQALYQEVDFSNEEEKDKNSRFIRSKSNIDELKKEEKKEEIKSRDPPIKDHNKSGYFFII